MQIICTSLQTDDQGISSSLKFLQPGCSSCRPVSSVKVLKAKSCHLKYFIFGVRSWQPSNYSLTIHLVLMCH